MSTELALYQCRLCLKKTPTRVDIYGGDFPRMLFTLTSIKVLEDDGLPKYSCTKCAREVQMAVMIKKRIIKAHEMLLDTLRKRKLLLERVAISPIANHIEAPKQTAIMNTKRKTISKKSKVVVKHCLTPVNSTKFVENSNQAVVDLNEENLESSIKIENIELIDSKTNVYEDENVRQDNNVHDALDEVQKHVQSTGFTCETCSLSFSDKPSLNLHRLKHKKSTCHLCGLIIRTDNIKKHIMLHSARPMVCSLCGTKCKNIESWRSHMFRQHKKKSEHICEECGKTFKEKYAFVLHKTKAHMGVKNFKCTTCGRSFFTNGNLMKHVRVTHEKLRPHVCEYCESGFSSLHALKTHKRQHTNEKPFVCNYCSEGFRQRVSLRSHLKSKHGLEEAKESVCKICEKGFATDYALSIHKRIHEVEKCDVCSETFAEKEYLNNHLRDVHNKEIKTTV